MSATLPETDEPSSLIDAADAVREDPYDVDEDALKREIVRASQKPGEEWDIAHKRLLWALSEVRRHRDGGGSA